MDDLFSEYNPNLKPTEMPGSKIAIDLQVEIDQVLVKVKNERIKFWFFFSNLKTFKRFKHHQRVVNFALDRDANVASKVVQTCEKYIIYHNL